MKRTMYAVYLPNDNEKWFGITFSTPSRAKWYAEMEGLKAGDFEIRPREELIEEKQVA